MNTDVTQRIQQLGRAARTLAMIGAWIKLQSETADPRIREQVEHGVRLALGHAPPLSVTELTGLLPTIGMALSESADLFHTIARPAGWNVVDETMLTAMGRASSGAFDRILALAAERPALAHCLTGRFLDVGTGVGGIALRAVESCPELIVEAIDIWEPALRLARQRVAGSPYGDRIHLRELDVTQLETEPRFTLAWLPTMFLPRATVRQAIERIASASQHGAWLVTALYTIPDDSFAAVMATLRTLRGGGEIAESAEIAALLRDRGYVDIEVDTASVATFVLGRLP
jgi:SAM-dependent methyltransferase